MTQRVGIVFRVRPGRAEEYDERHAEVWPELEREMRAAGLHRYVIYRWGDVLVGHLEVDDYAAFVQAMTRSEVSARWEESMGELIEVPNADPATGWPEQMREVWSLGYDGSGQGDDVA